MVGTFYLRSRPESPSFIEKGDVVVEVNRHLTPDLATYTRVVEGLPEGGVAWLYVRRPSSKTSFLAKLVREGATQTR